MAFEYVCQFVTVVLVIHKSDEVCYDVILSLCFVVCSNMAAHCIMTTAKKLFESSGQKSSPRGGSDCQRKYLKFYEEIKKF